MLGDCKLINIRQTPFDNILNAFIKRAMDVVGSLVLIVLTSPIMLGVAIGVKLSSPGRSSLSRSAWAEQTPLYDV